MFSQTQLIVKLQNERRLFAIHNQQLERSQKLQKQKADELAEELKEEKKRSDRLEKENQKLRGQLEKANVTIKTYKQMLFDKHQHTEVEEETKDTKGKDDKKQNVKLKQKNGQKKGHKGFGRKNPTPDQSKVCFLTVCPDCGTPLKRGKHQYSHTVTDIPHFSEMNPVTTEYQIDYQWCTNCHKTVTGQPFAVIPGSRIGTMLFLMILIWRYQLRLPFKKISEILFMQYNMSLSPGAVVGITEKAKHFFGKRYDNLLKEIRGAPVKYADETSWGMDGLLYWCWVFLTDKVVYYTIEESRGKGVPERILKDAIGILVRDGYAAYLKLPLIQQACFAHLYRKARDAAKRVGASDEAKAFFHEIRQLYGLLAEDIKRPFIQKEREEFFLAYKKDLEKLSAKTYHHEDAKRVQKYMTNLGDNLLTALLHKDVPLTNNAAEQAERQIVIGRKISGGSRSPEGAKTHAVNMSITQTILKQNLPLFATLESYILESLPKVTQKN